MRKLGIFVIGALVAALMAQAAVAAPRTKPNISFFSGSQSDAHWTPLESSDPNRMSIELEVGPIDSFGYAGFVLNRVEGTFPPEVEPGYWHKEDRASAATGGSPRLVLQFSDGSMYLRPDNWSTDWQEVGNDQDDGNWDVLNKPCATGTFDREYEEALACFAGQSLVSVFMVTDSNWMADKADGYTNWIDQLQYDGFEYSHASDNNNSQAA